MLLSVDGEVGLGVSDVEGHKHIRRAFSQSNIELAYTVSNEWVRVAVSPEDFSTEGRGHSQVSELQAHFIVVGHTYAFSEFGEEQAISDGQ